MNSFKISTCSLNSISIFKISKTELTYYEIEVENVNFRPESFHSSSLSHSPCRRMMFRFQVQLPVAYKLKPLFTFERLPKTHGKEKTSELEMVQTLIPSLDYTIDCKKVALNRPID